MNNDVSGVTGIRMTDENCERKVQVIAEWGNDPPYRIVETVVNLSMPSCSFRDRSTYYSLEFFAKDALGNPSWHADRWTSAMHALAGEIKAGNIIFAFTKTDVK